MEYTGLDRLLEFVGPDAIDHDTEFAVDVAGTEFTYGIDDFPDTQVVIADLATGDIRKTFFVPGITEPWSLVHPSPDDTRYAALVTRIPSPRLLPDVDVDPGAVPVSTIGCPDLSLIAYADQSAISVVPFAGGAAPKRVAESLPDLGEPTFSPDGEFLALSRDGDSGFLLTCDGVYVVPVLLTGDPVYLIGGDNDPFTIVTAAATRVTSCGPGMFSR